MVKHIDWESQIGRKLRLRDLYAFITVARFGSMAKGAEKLGVSQPAVSKVIADLEHALGVRLLNRSRRGVEPTCYGDALLKRGVVAFDELKQGIRDIEYLADPTAGELTIGCADSIAATLLLPIIDEFYARYPGVVPRVDTLPSPAVNYQGLLDRNYDLVLGRWPMLLANLPEELKADLLFDDRLVVAAGIHTPWARRRKIDLGRLVGEPWILPPRESWTYSFVSDAFRARALAMPRVDVMTFSLPLAMHLLANGPFITVFPQSVMSLHSEQRHLKILPVDLPAHSWPVVILTLKNRILSPVVERFAECAHEVAKLFSGKIPRP